jgi:hypothetical protein
MSSFARLVSAIDFFHANQTGSRAGRVACRIDLVSQTILCFHFDFRFAQFFSFQLRALL